MNRSCAPELFPLDKVNFIRPETLSTESGIPIFLIRNTHDDALKISFRFAAGKIYQTKALQASFATDLLFSGTDLKLAKEIEEEIDVLGAFKEVETGYEDAELNLYCLSKNALKVLEIVCHAIGAPSYPEEEFVLHKNRSCQRFSIELEKVSTLARRGFIQHLFAGTSLSNQTELNDFEAIDREDLLTFYHKNIRNGLLEISVVGNLDSDSLHFIQQYFNSWKKQTPLFALPSFESNKIHTHLPKKNALQTAIRIGKIAFPPTHNDAVEFKVLNTVLGGYFGSRLMSNLREDKGYTYGIHSGISYTLNTGYFYISTEVDAKAHSAALDEIKNEIYLLQKQEIGKDELQLVKKYLLGQFLKNSDGAFAMMDRFLFLNHFHLSQDYYETYIKKIEAVSAESLLNLSRKYLIWEDFTIISAG